MSTISNAERIWNTVKYMTPRQWIYRLYYIARRPFKRKTKIRTTKIVITKIPYIYKKGIPKTGFLEEADGIDVYKRQIVMYPRRRFFYLRFTIMSAMGICSQKMDPPRFAELAYYRAGRIKHSAKPVSYTHLNAP